MLSGTAPQFLERPGNVVSLPEQQAMDGLVRSFFKRIISRRGILAIKDLTQQQGLRLEKKLYKKKIYSSLFIWDMGEGS